MSNTDRTISIYAYNHNDKIDSYFTERKLFLSLELKLLQKRHLYNINKDYSAFGVVFKNSNYENNMINLAPKAFQRFFYKRYTEIDTEELSLKLGKVIIEKTLAGEDINLLDFEFEIWGGSFIFSTIENNNKTHTLFVFFPKDDIANARITKRNDWAEGNLLDFVNHVEVDTYEKYISNELDTKLLLLLPQDLLKNFMNEYNTTSYNNVQCIDYDEVRLTPNYVSAVLKIAEYLGHGSYMKDMSKADKDSISKYVVDGGTKKYEMFKPLRLKGKSVFYTGKGTASYDEKLIILS